MLNLPNTITLIRILLVPVFLVLFWWSSNPYGIALGMAVLALAGLTDILDGYLARKHNLVTPLGKVLDPFADKLIVVTAMISLFLVGRFPLWLVILVLVKDLILVIGSSFVVLKEKSEVSASIYGKIATVVVYTALFSGAFQMNGGVWFALAAGVVSVLALASYIWAFIRRHVY